MRLREGEVVSSLAPVVETADEETALASPPRRPVRPAGLDGLDLAAPADDGFAGDEFEDDDEASDEDALADDEPSSE